MRRKFVSVVLIVLVLFSMLLSGCKRSATPPIGNIQREDETTAMIQEAGANPTVAATEAATVAATTTPATEAAPATTEPAPVTEPAVVATEVVPVATEVATVEATVVVVEPTVIATAEPVVAGGPGKHVVQPGENLFRIALRYGTTVEELAKANGITNVNMISVGQELTIPGGTPGGVTPPPTTPPAPPSGTGKTYVVQPGENLFRIALKYNYSYHYLAKYNGIAYPYVIYPGQVIRIP